MVFPFLSIISGKLKLSNGAGLFYPEEAVFCLIFPMEFFTNQALFNDATIKKRSHA